MTDVWPKPDWECPGVRLYRGDAAPVLRTLPEGSVQCVVTSPPYWGLRDYGVEGQLGLEATPQEYVAKLVAVFREVRRVLRGDGTVWLNLGDSYNAGRDGGHPGGKAQWKPEQAKYQNRSGANVPGLKPKDLVGIPWRVAFALQADGWWLRQDIIWHKPNPMPESVTDRCTKAHEYIFLLAKSAKYHCDMGAVKEAAAYAGQPRGGSTQRYEQNAAGMDNREYDTRNRRSVWSVTTKPYPKAHFATYPPELIEPCIMAGCPAGGVVLDPFIGSGTTALVALKHGCQAVGIELNRDYLPMIQDRLRPVVTRIDQEQRQGRMFA